MTYIPIKPLSFDKFLEQYPEDGKRYELVDGEIIPMRGTKERDSTANYSLFAFYDRIKRLDLDSVLEQSAAIKTTTKDGWEQGRNPDVSVIDGAVWDALFPDYAAFKEPIPLAVEVVSTNWRIGLGDVPHIS